ncbi:hypothetical protein ADK33_15550 [Streptomyces griseus subsp. rhodochrous]|nr:hypothetical protein ADK33_15550 [Streptomyces griseus subsp. rhodochrous]
MRSDFERGSSLWNSGVSKCIPFRALQISADRFVPKVVVRGQTQRVARGARGGSSGMRRPTNSEGSFLKPSTALLPSRSSGGGSAGACARAAFTLPWASPAAVLRSGGPGAGPPL